MSSVASEEVDELLANDSGSADMEIASTQDSNAMAHSSKLKDRLAASLVSQELMDKGAVTPQAKLDCCATLCENLSIILEEVDEFPSALARTVQDWHVELLDIESQVSRPERFVASFVGGTGMVSI